MLNIMRQNTEFKTLTSYVTPDSSQKTPLRNEDSVDTTLLQLPLKSMENTMGKKQLLI